MLHIDLPLVWIVDGRVEDCFKW